MFSSNLPENICKCFSFFFVRSTTESVGVLWTFALIYGYHTGFHNCSTVSAWISLCIFPIYFWGKQLYEVYSGSVVISGGKKIAKKFIDCNRQKFFFYV